LISLNNLGARVVFDGSRKLREGGVSKSESQKNQYSESGDGRDSKKTFHRGKAEALQEATEMG
jgi:hypothetical protein